VKIPRTVIDLNTITVVVDRDRGSALDAGEHDRPPVANHLDRVEDRLCRGWGDVDDHVGQAAVGELLDARDDVLLVGDDRCAGPQLARELELCGRRRR
jgi:hypothetical protein